MYYTECKPKNKNGVCLGMRLPKSGNELETVKLHPKCKIHVNDQIARQEEAVYIMSGLKLIAHSLQSLGKLVDSSLDLQIRVVRQNR